MILVLRGFSPEREKGTGWAGRGEVRCWRPEVSSVHSQVVWVEEQVVSERMAAVAGVGMKWAAMGPRPPCSLIPTNLKLVKCCNINIVK